MGYILVYAPFSASRFFFFDLSSISSLSRNGILSRVVFGLNLFKKFRRLIFRRAFYRRFFQPPLRPLVHASLITSGWRTEKATIERSTGADLSTIFRTNVTQCVGVFINISTHHALSFHYTALFQATFPREYTPLAIFHYKSILKLV